MNDRRQLAIKLCKKFPEHTSLGLSRMLYKENPEWFSNLEGARSLIRSVRGANGKKNRKSPQKTGAEREHGKAGYVPSCPPSISETWEPLVVDRPERTLVLSDVHVPFHDDDAVQAAVKYGKSRKPTTVILNGDIADCFSVSRYVKNPKFRDLRREIEDTKQFLRWIRHEFKKADILYKFGNHEVRLDHFVWTKAPELWSLEAVQLHNLLEFDKLGVVRVDDVPMMVGKLPILHGHELPRGISNPVNPARGAFLRTLHTVLIGHLHQTSSHADTSMFKKEIMTWSTGALCSLQPEYARINRWNHGFAFVEADGEGFNVSNFRIAGGQVRSS